MTKRERIAEIFEDALCVDGYDEAIIGITEDSCKVVYDLYKMQVIAYEEMKNPENPDEYTFEDACEHVSYNITSAYVGDFTPIYVWIMPDEADIPEFNYGYGKGDK